MDVRRNWLWIILVLSSILQASSCGVSTSSFSRKYICNLNDRISKGCARLLPRQYTSLSQCANACLANSSCVGVTTAAGNKCYLHDTCSLNISTGTCTKVLNVSLYVVPHKACLNGGSWNIVGKTCQCSGGWVGDFCERYASFCAELLKYGYPTGEHDITMQVNNASTPFQGKCNVMSSTVHNTYILKTVGTNLSADSRTWNDYVKGFWSWSFDFWIGLDNMKALNDKGLTHLRLDTCFVKSEIYYIRGYNYYDFTMGGADVNYTFSFLSTKKESAEFNYGDCLSPVMGAQFSTRDRDNDEEDAQNCAIAQMAGWWIKRCNSRCNPMGSSLTRKMDGFDLADGYYEIIMYFMNP